MRFLVDEDLPRSVLEVIERHGHSAVLSVEALRRGASDEEIAALAREKSLCLLTGDLDFADIRNYPPSSYAGMVVLRLPSTATSSYIVELIDYFLSKREVVERLGGKLAIVEAGRIRLRPSS